MVALRKHAPARMTLNEFLSWDSGDPSGRAWQLIDGEPLAMAPGSETHGAIQGELIGLLRNHLIEQRSPCRVIAEPGIVPRVRADRNYRIADLGVTCAAPSLGLMVPEPVLLVEILSPSNEAETRANVCLTPPSPACRNFSLSTARGSRRSCSAETLTAPGLEQPDIITADGMLSLASIAFADRLVALCRATALARH
jgi:hypothetical protein